MNDDRTTADYGTDDQEAYPAERYDGDADYDPEYYGGEDDGGWLDEGVITLLLVTGVALFVFPEPATSGIGIVLIVLGVVVWTIDWLS